MENLQKTKIQDEALKAVLTHKRAGVAISMGVGKTRLAIRHMLNVRHFYLFTRFLVVVPKNPIIKTWEKEIDDLGYTDLHDQITYINYRSLHKVTEHYDVIYLDECHSLLPGHSQYLDKHAGCILGLTGTPPRYHDSEKGRLVQAYCPMIYTYITNEAVDDGLLNDYRIYIHRIPLSTTKEYYVEMKNGGGWWTSERENYDYWDTKCEEALSPAEKQKSSIQRMASMLKFPSKENYAKYLLKDIHEKCLVFANNKKQADRLCDHSYYSGNKSSKENLELFINGDVTKLSCVNQLSMGINVPNLKYALIMHAFGNERSAAQRFGRMLRLPTDQTSHIHLLVYEDTIDEHWAYSALKDFDQSKIVEFEHEL